MLTHFVNTLPVLNEPKSRRSGAPARVEVARGRTENRAKMARYIEESPRYATAGALSALNAALQKARR